jgi:phenylacetate-CoA ligase
MARGSPPVPFSAVEGIEWPAIASPAGARMLTLQWQLERSQWWSPEQIRQQQFRQIRALVAHAVANVPFYRHSLEQTSLSDAGRLDPESFRKFPLLGKSAVRENEKALRAVTLPPGHGAVMESTTTGSTGIPVRILRSGLDNFFAGALVVREHLLHGRDLSLKLGTIRGGVEEASQPGWGVINAAFATGPGCAIPLEAGVERHLEWLLREEPDYLLATPRNAHALAMLSRERGIRPRNLLEVMTFAATLPEDLRTIVRDSWGVSVIDTYSCGEAGGLAMQCPGHLHYLVQAENVYMEVLRDDGSPCLPGETGRVVITPLHNFAMPLIRYELGDYAQVGDPCPTGRGLPTLARIAGRVRNMLRDPNGRRLFASIPAGLWLEVDPIRQARLVQRTLSQIEVQLVMGRDLTASEAERLTAALREHLGYPFEIILNRVNEIERQPGGKFEDVLSLLPQD